MMNTLNLRFRSFFLDIVITSAISFLLIVILKKVGIISKPEAYREVTKWTYQIYYIVCFLVIPARTLGMKLCNLSFVSLKKDFDFGLWNIVRFYFFQSLFFFPAIISIFMFVKNGSDGMAFVFSGILFARLDFLPILQGKDYLFLHDALSGIKINTDKLVDPIQVITQ